MVYLYFEAVAASSLGLENLNRFLYDKATIKKLFNACKEDGDGKIIKEIGHRVKHYLEQCKSVIPRSIVMQKCIDLERGLLINTGADKTELCEEILGEMNDDAVGSSKKEIVKTSVQQCITKQNLSFLTWLQELREIQ